MRFRRPIELDTRPADLGTEGKELRGNRIVRSGRERHRIVGPRVGKRRYFRSAEDRRPCRGGHIADPRWD